MNIVSLNDRSSQALLQLLETTDSDILFIGDPDIRVDPSPRMFDRMSQVIRETRAAWVFADGVGRLQIDYQPGSIRDTFNFGPVSAISVAAARDAGVQPRLRWGGLYDLRLRLSEKYPIIRIPEALYSLAAENPSAGAIDQFNYVDPRNRDYQLEMEMIATAHLKRIGAWLPAKFEIAPAPARDWPVKASVIIPVRNRERTILDAVKSALAQKTDFEFNVILVNNHSTDRTPEILRSINDRRLCQIVPDRADLGIGGCWNEAIYSPLCGQYCVQLDSDDLYSNERVLNRIVEMLESGPYAMVVGSYTLVDYSLKEIPPGLIDHREWSRENGRNNALRVNGLGAPRAFNTAVLRRIGFPNVSYGEDYAVALRISREYEIGRIYDSIYLCRRWEGNSDSSLPREIANRYDFYKDWLRTIEIKARMTR